MSCMPLEFHNKRDDSNYRPCTYVLPSWDTWRQVSKQVCRSAYFVFLLSFVSITAQWIDKCKTPQEVAFLLA